MAIASFVYRMKTERSVTITMTHKNTLHSWQPFENIAAIKRKLTQVAIRRSVLRLGSTIE